MNLPALDESGWLGNECAEKFTHSLCAIRHIRVTASFGCFRLVGEEKFALLSIKAGILRRR
jgi:hypothetical protein